MDGLSLRLTIDRADWTVEMEALTVKSTLAKWEASLCKLKARHQPHHLHHNKLTPNPPLWLTQRNDLSIHALIVTFAQFQHAAMKDSIHCVSEWKSPHFKNYPVHYFRNTVRFFLFWINKIPTFFIVLFDFNFITWSCAGGGVGGVLTTDRRRPSHRWGNSETHPPSAPHWPALATSRWAARVWTRTAPSEGKEGGWGVTARTKWRQVGGEHEE